MLSREAFCKWKPWHELQKLFQNCSLFVDRAFPQWLRCNGKPGHTLEQHARFQYQNMFQRSYAYHFPGYCEGSASIFHGILGSFWKVILWVNNSGGFLECNMHVVSKMGWKDHSKHIPQPIPDWFRTPNFLSLEVLSKLHRSKSLFGFLQNLLESFPRRTLRNLPDTKICICNVWIYGFFHHTTFDMPLYRMFHQDFGLQLIAVCLWNLQKALELMDHNELIFRRVEAEAFWISNNFIVKSC